MSDLIDRQAAIDAFWKLEVELRPSAIDAVWDMLKNLPSAEGKEYIKWLEDKLCECEPVWLCEDNEKFTDWCYENCVWSSIQPQCLRHIFSVCGAKMER